MTPRFSKSSQGQQEKLVRKFEPRHHAGVKKVVLTRSRCCPTSPVSCFHTTGCEAYFLTTDGYGIFNVRIIWVRAVRTKGGGQAETGLRQEFTWRDRKTAVTLTRHGDGTQGLRI